MSSYTIFNSIIFILSLTEFIYTRYMVTKIQKQRIITNKLLDDLEKNRDEVNRFIVETNITNLSNLEWILTYINNKSENWQEYSESYIKAVKDRIIILNEMLTKVKDTNENGK